MRRIYLLILLAAATLAPAACGHEVTAEGRKLASVLDAMNVEKLWLPGRYVNWQTGETLPKKVRDGKPHTHCSAFVAAACAKLGVYILRPPEHSTVLLANAQYDWLHDKGRDHGWFPIKSAKEAQRLANRGVLVVATFKEKNPKKSGHIAIVRPSTKSDEQIREAGPQIIQAGGHNANSTTLKRGFGNHPTAWRDRQVRYFGRRMKAVGGRA